MSETEKTQDQAPAPFRVGDKVRCVDTMGTKLQKNMVYTVIDFDGLSHSIVYLKGVPESYGSYRFVPAIPFVDRSGKKWLVVDRRKVEAGDHFIAENGIGTETGGVIRATDGIPPCVRKIVVPWQEFPAPEAKGEPVNWSKIALTPHEAEQLFAIHAAGSLGDGYLIDASLGASLRDKGLVSRDHQGNRPTVAGNNWVITAWLGRTNWKGLYEDARRELALVVQVLSGKGGVSDDMGSEALKMALGVMAEIAQLKEEADTDKFIIGQHGNVLNKIQAVVQALPSHLKIGGFLHRSVEALYDDWKGRCAYQVRMESECDSLRARISELERFLAIADEDKTNHLRKIEELKAAPITLDKIARSISAHYPDAEVVIVKVVRDGGLVFAPTTEYALIAAHDALAGVKPLTTASAEKESKADE